MYAPKPNPALLESFGEGPVRLTFGSCEFGPAPAIVFLAGHCVLLVLLLVLIGMHADVLIQSAVLAGH